MTVRGMSATVYGAGPAHALYYSSYEKIKALLSRADHSNHIVHGQYTGLHKQEYTVGHRKSNCVDILTLIAGPTLTVFNTRCNIYLSPLRYDVSVRLSVSLSVCDGSALAHYS